MAREQKKVVDGVEAFESWLGPVLKEKYIWKYPLKKITFWKDSEINDTKLAYDIFCDKWLPWTRKKKRDRNMLKKAALIRLLCCIAKLSEKAKKDA